MSRVRALMVDTLKRLSSSAFRTSFFLIPFLALQTGCREQGNILAENESKHLVNQSLLMALANSTSGERCFFSVQLDSPMPVYFKLHEKPFLRTSQVVSDQREAALLDFLWANGSPTPVGALELLERQSAEVPYVVKMFLSTMFLSGHLDEVQGQCGEILGTTIEGANPGGLALLSPHNRGAWLFHGLLCLISASVTQLESCGSPVERKKIPRQQGDAPIIRSL